MKKQSWVFSAFIAATFLIGAGCAPIENNDTPNDILPPNTDATTTVSTPQIPEPADDTEDDEDSEFTLEAEALGNSRVRLQWSMDGDLAAGETFRLVRGPKENPVYPGNFWFHPKAMGEETTWLNVPKGEQHFRACLFKNNQCTVYSNDVKIMVK